MEKKHGSFSKAGTCLVEPVIAWARDLELFAEALLCREYSSFSKTRNMSGRCSNGLGPGLWGSLGLWNLNSQLFLLLLADIIFFYSIFEISSNPLIQYYLFSFPLTWSSGVIISTDIVPFLS